MTNSKPDELNSSTVPSSIEQKVDNAVIEGGIQAVDGNSNNQNQVSSNPTGNVVTINGYPLKTDGAKEGLGSAFGEIIKSAGVPPAKVIGSWLGEILTIHYAQWRTKQAEKIVEGAGEILAELNLEPTVCKPKILIPLIEQASLEEDEDLAKKWMGLLASAVTDDSTHPSYVKILSELVSTEAKILDYVYAAEINLLELQELARQQRKIASSEEYHKIVGKISKIKQNFNLRRAKKDLMLENEDLSISIDNLLRLKLCEHPETGDEIEVITGASITQSTSNNKSNEEYDIETETEYLTNRVIDTDSIRLTALGKNFMKACQS